MRNFIRHIRSFEMYREDLGNLLKENNLNSNGAEIGVAEGNFSEVIIKNFGLKTVYLIDSWKEHRYWKGIITQKQQDEIYNKVSERVSPYGDKVKIVKENSENASKLFEDNFFDFIYIDASHFYNDICNDLKLWYPKLRTGGCFSGHDYHRSADKNNINGVFDAVNEFCAINKIKVSVTKGSYRIPSSWYFIKK